MKPAAIAGAVVLAIAAVALAVGVRAIRGSPLAGVGVRAQEAQCGAGLVATGARCCRGDAAHCSAGWDPPRARVAIPATTLLLGPSDWEAEGRVAPRTLRVDAFAIDAFEATLSQIDAEYTGSDPARAASRVTRDDAERYCAARGGRLPTEDEWIAAAAGPSARRYPWGDTGAVCRRAAWGLADGPCSSIADGPDTIGAHPDGDTATGLHDMAGNVAEWVRSRDSTPSLGIARGGSWRTALAAELRTWARLELDPAAKDDRVGVRCAYDR